MRRTALESGVVGSQKGEEKAGRHRSVAPKGHHRVITRNAQAKARIVAATSTVTSKVEHLKVNMVFGLWLLQAGLEILNPGLYVLGQDAT